MTSRSVASVHVHAPATSKAWRREAEPSSDPTRTIRPNGPLAKDSGGRTADGSARPTPFRFDGSPVKFQGDDYFYVDPNHPSPKW